jgi:outer membrane protein OmpA-like peptidoglycan-associated protein
MRRAWWRLWGRPLVIAVLAVFTAGCMSGRGQAEASGTTAPASQPEAHRDLPDVQPPPTVSQDPSGRTIVRLNEEKAALFAVDSAVISPAGDTSLIAAVDQMAGSTGSIEVHGYTDGVGEANYNMGLSQQRAAAVVTWLSQHGVDPGRLTAKGHGEEGATDEVDDPFSRRVEIVYYQEAAP